MDVYPNQTSSPQRIDFLHVRWLGRDTHERFGDTECRLERVRFVTKEDGSPPFGFIDPNTVVRAAHLIPAFMYGRTNKLLGASRIARVKDNTDVDDWESFLVNKRALISTGRYIVDITHCQFQICRPRYRHAPSRWQSRTYNEVLF